jgi:hypothetical protein
VTQRALFQCEGIAQYLKQMVSTFCTATTAIPNCNLGSSEYQCASEQVEFEPNKHKYT